MQQLPFPFHCVSQSDSWQAELICQTGKQIPGSVHYSIARYRKPSYFAADDVGLFNYVHQSSNRAENYLEMRFCLVGNVYCSKTENECNKCRSHDFFGEDEKIESVDFLDFVFSSTLLEQFVKSRISNSTFSEDLLCFKSRDAFSKRLPISNRTRLVLESLLNHSYSDSLGNIFVNAQTQMLLLYSLDGMDDKELDFVGCKFLANEADQEKIIKARELLLEHIGQPITIKALSRKVAMNECYLKKGFKEMFGTTIFDFYQSQRMEHARYLLYEKGLSVTEVSMMLGYSSISHFSTAFKKHTGLKPCELLK
ncbi:MAG: AraC family transcriptional regulator [Flavisolibacter sp.]